MMFESEEYRIAQRIKDFIKDEEPPKYVYIMLRNKRILDINNYRDMFKDGRINPMDAYVYIDIDIGWGSSNLYFHYPFLVGFGGLLSAYLSKLGFYYEDYVGYYYVDFVVPATGLKYIAFAEVSVEHLSAEDYKAYLSVEVTNLDTIANNTNLRKIVFEVLGSKLISGKRKLTKDEYDKISDMLSSQRLFAGYNADEAFRITSDYYYNGDQSLVKEVARIAMDYDRVFPSYRVCYDMDSWKEIDCSTIE